MGLLIVGGRPRRDCKLLVYRRRSLATPVPWALPDELSFQNLRELLTIHATDTQPTNLSSRSLIRLPSRCSGGQTFSQRRSTAISSSR